MIYIVAENIPGFLMQKNFYFSLHIINWFFKYGFATSWEISKLKFFSGQCPHFLPPENIRKHLNYFFGGYFLFI